MPILGVIDSAKTGNLATPAMDYITKFTVTSQTNTVTFSSIPQTYSHLLFRTSFLTNSASGVWFNKVNAVADGVGFSGNRTNFPGPGSLYQQSFTGTPTGSGGYMTLDDGLDGNTYQPSTHEVWFSAYTDTDNRKASIATNGAARSSGSGLYNLSSGSILGTTAAINSLRLSGLGSATAWDVGTVIWLYGIKGA